MNVTSFSSKYQKQGEDLISNILEKEFWHQVTPENRPDIFSIAKTYQTGKGNFWVALEDDFVIWTIWLKEYWNERGYLKRLYVKKEFRGNGVAQRLMDTLIKYAHKKSYKKIYLWTDETMVAANRFYQKSWFKRIPSLPYGIPCYDDTIFYEFSLE